MSNALIELQLGGEDLGHGMKGAELVVIGGIVGDEARRMFKAFQDLLGLRIPAARSAKEQGTRVRKPRGVQ